MKRIFGILIVITALLLPQAALAASNNVKLLNISIDKGKIQTDNNVQKVIIEITDLADFTIKENGNKLLVQLNNAKIGSTVKNMAVNTELIKDIKVDKITKTSTMVNIGLSKEISKVEYTVSTLPKNSKTKKGFCVVLTLQESNNKFLFSPNIKFILKTSDKLPNISVPDNPSSENLPTTFLIIFTFEPHLIDCPTTN